MNFPKLDCTWLIAFLSIAIATKEASPVVPTIVPHDPPFWQFVLREFVFKTISSPLSSNVVLYEKLLDAPFYGGPLPMAFDNDNALVSRGNVYRTPGGQWILCQDGCADCESCERQKNPKVKWILRRVMRTTSRSDLPKWDLRLTVFPQPDESSRSSKRPRYDDFYATSQEELGGETSLRDSGPATAEQVFATDRNSQSFGLERSDWTNKETRSNEESNDGGAGLSEDLQVSRKIATSPERVKRHRVKPTGRPIPLTFYYPQEDVTATEGPTERLRDEKTPRLIVGIDQHGEKHLVHVVPVDSPADELDSTSHRSSYRADDSAKIGRTTQRGRDGLTYEKLLDRIMNSLNTHRSFIEKFIFSDRLEPDDRNEAVRPALPSHPERANDDYEFDGRNFDDYRFEASPRFDTYPTDSGYQTHERDDRFKGRYDDAEGEVNRPSGEYQDRTTEYQARVTSAIGRQDERSPPSTDVERRRRNLFPKLLAPTDELRGITQNHTEIYTPDTKFSMKSQLPENSTNQEFADSRLRINETDARNR